MPKIQIGGILQSSELALIQLLGLSPGAQATSAVLRALGEQAISAQAVVECRDCGGGATLAFTVSQANLEQALGAVEAAAKELGAQAVQAVPNVGLIAIHGPHFADRPAIAGTMFSALALAGIEPLLITSSISTVAGVIAAQDIPRAVAVLKETFLLP